MGNFDKWSTPKQVKIERRGDPRPLHRGPFKKGQRKKGKKARLDELASSKRWLELYTEWILMERQNKIDHPEWYRPSKYVRAYKPRYEEMFDEQYTKHMILIGKAILDGVITAVEGLDWRVKKP